MKTNKIKKSTVKVDFLIFYVYVYKPNSVLYLLESKDSDNHLSVPQVTKRNQAALYQNCLSETKLQF